MLKSSKVAVEHAINAAGRDATRHSDDVPASSSGSDRHSMVAKVAYSRAEQRDFAPGHELDDWLAAEAEVDERLAAAPSESSRPSRHGPPTP